MVMVPPGWPSHCLLKGAAHFHQFCAQGMTFQAPWTGTCPSELGAQLSPSDPVVHPATWDAPPLNPQQPRCHLGTPLPLAWPVEYSPWLSGRLLEPMKCQMAAWYNETIPYFSVLANATTWSIWVYLATRIYIVGMICPTGPQIRCYSEELDFC